MKFIMNGNEAIARGAYEAGVKLASGYPGTPVTEIIDITANKYKDIYTEWSTNEKVALEVAIGASFAGYRSYSVMKSVGLNVAHDSLMAASQGNINGGLVVVVSDDVGRITDDHNDSRYYGNSVKIPILEPSDSLEGISLMQKAFEISEKFNLPVLVRVTSVFCKSSSIVNIENSFNYKEKYRKVFEKSYYAVFATTFMIGMKDCENKQALEYHNNFVKSMKDLQLTSKDYNLLELNDKKIGIITSGIAYHYVKEAIPNASVLKLNLINPLPIEQLYEISNYVDKLYVIEEGQNVLENNIKSIGINVIGEKIFEKFPKSTSLSVEIIREKLVSNYSNLNKPLKIPFRLPSNCAGCSHLFIYNVLKKNKIHASTDVTCGGLGIFPHINAFCNGKNMGASIGMAHGYNIVSKDIQKHVAVIGDGGFWATGINGLINSVFNKGNSVIIIVDNGCIAMTGGQKLPSMSEKVETSLSILETCKVLGIKDIVEVDPYDVANLEIHLLKAMKYIGNSVIIAKKECLRKFKTKKQGMCKIKVENCVMCKKCLYLGCLAIVKTNSLSNETEKIEIIKDLCVGCKLCQNNCKNGAIQYYEN